ncbi:hypothetical protein CPB83DRAFT_841381 [Crepidotus variabilis]|uniref:Uncharacterized protein n=1 Tax=Crepidotus variabilis TaxID=179855 RepID=A0A9P6E2I1_9AGAR|nr:hypothetical protein CPB83DRAFT_841381 [Crepidotus variabilis]
MFDQSSFNKTDVLPVECMKGSLNFSKTNGRVYLLPDGQLFYSPNTCKPVSVPPPPVPGQNIFTPPSYRGRPNYWGLNIHNFLQPQWWTHQFGWVSFLDSSLLEADKALLYQQDWLKLEYQLRNVHILLHKHYFYPTVSPHEPSKLGYLSSHINLRILQIALKKSREWFSLWMALALFSIACAEAQEEYYRPYPHLARAKWTDWLVAEGASYNIDHCWVDKLAASSVASFRSNSRAGVFVNLKGGEWFQPAPSWFCKHHIPVCLRPFASPTAKHSIVSNEIPN